MYWIWDIKKKFRCLRATLCGKGLIHLLSHVLVLMIILAFLFIHTFVVVSFFEECIFGAWKLPQQCFKSISGGTSSFLNEGCEELESRQKKSNIRAFLCLMLLVAIKFPQINLYYFIVWWLYYFLRCEYSKRLCLWICVHAYMYGDSSSPSCGPMYNIYYLSRSILFHILTSSLQEKWT